jgi:uncharacterized damage-inducible protein DinB
MSTPGTNVGALIGRMVEHMAWADRRVLSALRVAEPLAPDLRDLFAHLVAAEWLWLDRAEGRAARLEVWPELELEAMARELDAAHEGWRALIARVTEAELDAPVAYVNSNAQAFETPLVDIVLHVVHHGSYHRGQLATRLRLAGHEPAASDLIGFARGVDAARTERD